MGLDVTGSYRYPPPNREWLGLRSEEILAPELPIIDAHHHLWIEGGRPYQAPELLEDIASGHKVIATVAVEARFGYREHGPEHLRSVGETEQLQLAAESARSAGSSARICAGIVGHVDLRGGADVEAALNAHQQAAPTRFKGVRHSVSRDENFPNGIVVRPAPAGLLGDPAYRAGLKAVARRGLSYDAMLYHQQIPELAAAAQELQDLPIVLDHFGCILGVGPYAGKSSEIFSGWRQDMAELARRPNVHVKLGGFGMIVCGARWNEAPTPPSSEQLASAWRPYVETCIELFGARRCMFESNFPVDKAMFSYAVLWNAFKRTAEHASADERSDLFSGTAARFYRLQSE